MSANINPDNLKTLAEAKEACAALQQSLQEKERQAEAQQAELAAAQAKTERLESSVKTKDQEIEALRDDLKAASEKLEQAQKETASLSRSLKDKDTARASHQAEKAAWEKTEKELREQIGELEAEAKSAEAKAADICASVGVEPVKAAPKEDAGGVSLLEQFKTIQDPAAQTAFWRKHREELIKLM